MGRKPDLDTLWSLSEAAIKQKEVDHNAKEYHRSLLPNSTITAAGICNNWKRKGSCTDDNCPYDHPKKEKGAGKGNPKAKPKPIATRKSLEAGNG